MGNFKHIPIDIPKCILDESKGYHRYTTPSGKKLDSVTTMLSRTKPEKDREGLARWRKQQGEQVANYIFSEAAIIGTETHTLNENYINMIEKDDNFSLLTHAHHENFKPLLDNVTNIYGVESRLFSEKLGLAGTADLIADYNGVLSIIDYKTKRSNQREEYIQDYFIQTTAYSLMWEELTGQKIEQLVILVSSEKNTRQEFKSIPQNHINSLNARIIQYNSSKNF